jgi:hypothetical protein
MTVNTHTNDLREMSATELDLVSGGEVKFVNIGPVTIAAGDGTFAIAVKGVGGIGVGGGSLCGAIKPLGGGCVPL